MTQVTKSIVSKLICSIIFCLPFLGFSQGRQRLGLVDKIDLPKLKGGATQMAYDFQNSRLFLSVPDHHSVEVIDLKKKKHLISIPGLNEPQGIFFYPQTNILYVATNDCKVLAIDARNYRKVKTYSFKEKCNNLRFDPVSNQLFVGVGATSGEIGMIDLNKNEITGHIALAGPPQQFELTKDYLMVNVPKHNRVQLVERKTSKVMKHWRLKGNNDNISMAVDRRNHLLYVGRSSGQLLIYSTWTGKELGKAAISKNVNSIVLDTLHAQLYISSAEGFVEVFRRRPRRLTLVQKIPLRAGTSAGLFMPETNQYMIAEPGKGRLPAAVKIFRPETIL